MEVEKENYFDENEKLIKEKKYSFYGRDISI